MATSASHKISVIGLGKLGAPLAAVLAEAGNQVIGVDTNPTYVAAVNDGRAPVCETGLEDAIASCSDRLRATSDCAEAVHESDISFVIVPTPSRQDNNFDNSYLVRALNDIGAAIREKPGYHLVAIVSTVTPGSTADELTSALESASGKQVGSDTLGLCYNPEFIALGNVLGSMRRPDFLLVGESDPVAGDLLCKVRLAACDGDVPVRRMNFINAEITKIAINTFVTTKISYANMLAEICENTPGADVDTVTSTVGSDSRIGTKYLKGAVGYGGPCFPRDNKAFAAFGASRGVECTLAEATDVVNERQLERVVDHVAAYAPKGSVICVLGLAYKGGTAELDDSHGVMLCQRLAKAGYGVRAHDPMAFADAAAELSKNGVQVFADTAKALEGCALAITMLPLPEYKDVPALLAKLGSPDAALLDPWRYIAPAPSATSARIIPLGKHVDDKGHEQ